MISGSVSISLSFGKGPTTVRKNVGYSRWTGVGDSSNLDGVTVKQKGDEETFGRHPVEKVVPSGKKP